MADLLVGTFVNINTLEAVAFVADFTLALSPTLVVNTERFGMATPILFLALVDVLAVGAISDVSAEAVAAVAAQVVVAAGLRVTAMQARETFVDVSAHQAAALPAHEARAGEGVSDLQTLGLRVALAARRLAVLQVGNLREQQEREEIMNLIMCQFNV